MMVGGAALGAQVQCNEAMMQRGNHVAVSREQRPFNTRLMNNVDERARGEDDCGTGEYKE